MQGPDQSPQSSSSPPPRHDRLYDRFYDRRLHTPTTLASNPRRATSPLALYEPQARSNTSSPAATHLPPQSPPGSNSSPNAHQVPLADATPPSVDRVRAPKPARKATADSVVDEIRAAAAADALKEEHAARRKTTAAIKAQPSPVTRNVSAPLLGGAALQNSPEPSSDMASSRSARQENRPNMPRTASIDSTVSSVSNASATQRPGGTNAYRISEPTGPQDAETLIAAAGGSVDAAMQKLITEKSSASSHNQQLWRLVEKQRTMILGLNRDLEKALKEKDRYRRKLKENLLQSQSAPSLTAAGQQADDVGRREDSESPALHDHVASASTESALRDASLASRKLSDASEGTSVRADTPQDASTANSTLSTALPATPQSATSTNAAARENESVNATTANQPTTQIERKKAEPPARLAHITRTPPISPKGTAQSPTSPIAGHKHTHSLTATSPTNGASFSGAFKGASRKAPPAPLNLSPKPQAPAANAAAEHSESEYEEDPDSARTGKMTRGRRKTREEDDQEREVLAQQDEEKRSKSKKDKKSKSKSQPPTDKPEIALKFASPPADKQAHEQPAMEQKAKPAAFQSGDPTAILRQRAFSDAAGLVQRTVTAPTLLSPGLPMSPRPGDRPLGSPMPRAPNKMSSSIPMSPRTGMPLSPRQPRQPIPMPPQTPSAFASPQVARIEPHQHQSQQSQGSINGLLKPSSISSPENERPDPKTPGEVYRGLVTEQYPDLLLPPNALPSIFVKTASSRMRPSRQSYMAPKHFDENPVFTLAVHERSDGKQLWRVEKTFAALGSLDQQVQQVAAFRDHVPDKSLFTGHAPAKVDARRQALDAYFDKMLDAVQDERAAKIVCKFLSSDAFGAEGGDYFLTPMDPRPDSPVSKGRTKRDGFLTKRGKNFGGWKARYFVLDGPSLKYFEAPGGAQLGTIRLQNAQIGKQSPGTSSGTGEDEDNQFRHAFLILEPKRKDSNSHVRHVLCAESDEERDDWVEALLQYVDCRDENEGIGGGVPISKLDMGGSREPRLQHSFNDLRPSSRGGDSSRSRHQDSVRSVGYEQTIAGEAPVMGPSSATKADSPSPPYDGSFSGGSSGGEQPGPNHPAISGPSNAHVIQNAGAWGMKPPPTPGHIKKKGFFGFRGRSSSDLANESAMTPGFSPESMHNRAVFGIPLAEAVEIARPAGVTTELPAVVYRCFEFLTEKGAVSEEGIFRLSGSSTVIKALRERFNVEGDIDLLNEETYHDIHAVGSLLKLFLRELPASILTRDLHLEFLKGLEMSSRNKVALLNKLVHQLPRPNFVLLQALSAFLSSIVNNADVNKMNVRNVGIVFAPTLNVPAPLISSFVEDQSVIFGPPIPIDEASLAAERSALSSPASHTPSFQDLRSPRKQIFTDLPTPGYAPAAFQNFGALHGSPASQLEQQQAQMQSISNYYQGTPTPDAQHARQDSRAAPAYKDYQIAPQGEGHYGSLNDALRSPGPQHQPQGSGEFPQPPSTPREARPPKRRESSFLNLSLGFSSSSSADTPGRAPGQKGSLSRLRQEEGARF